MKSKRLCALALATLCCGFSQAATNEGATEAQFQRVLMMVAAQLNQSVAKAPPQTSFIQFEKASVGVGRNFMILYRIPKVPTGNGISQDPERLARSEGMLRPMALRNLCPQRLTRQLLSDKVTLNLGFIAANGDKLGLTKIVEKDCASFPMPAGVLKN